MFTAETPNDECFCSFSKSGNVLKDSWNPTNGESLKYRPLSSFRLHYRISPRLGLESGIQYLDKPLIVHDQRFQGSTNYSSDREGYVKINTYADNGNFAQLHYYQSTFAGARLRLGNMNNEHFGGEVQHLGNDYNVISVYLSSGVAYNHFISSGTQSSWSYNYAPTDESLQMKSHYLKNYWSAYLELGMGGFYNENSGHPRYLSFSIKYIFSGNMSSMDYSDVQNGKVQYTDHVKSRGNYVAWIITFGIHKSKSKKSTPEIRKRSYWKNGGSKHYNQLPTHKKVRSPKASPHYKKEKSFENKEDSRIRN
jgi:hypothetical protein